MVVVDLLSSWPLSSANDLRDELLAAYADPARSYHDTRHLTEVLTRIDEIAASGFAFDPVPVVLAAWFHDAVYDGERDSEERSATWAEQSLAPHTEPGTVVEVVRLVRMTETHRPEDDDPNGCVLSDADLAILAAPSGRYAEYVATVRAEYAHVPDDLFRHGRSNVLRDLAAKPHLFHTAYAREHWEAPARANLGRELDSLSSATSGDAVPQRPAG